MRRRDETGAEPKGCASRSAFGTLHPRSYKGRRSLWRVGIFCGDLLARRALWPPHVAQSARLHGGCCLSIALGIGANTAIFSVATQRSWKNAEDEWVSKVEWHRVAIIWN